MEPTPNELDQLSPRLPDFIIVGAMRCGTSAMRRLLGSHPQCSIDEPELNFFTSNWARGVSWYASHFPSRLIAGEKSPGYLANPRALLRISRLIPDVKLVVQMRDPCRRFLSHFQHTNRHLPPPKRWANVRSFLESKDSDDALWRGMYAAQLHLLFQLFPRNNVHLVYNEQMRSDTELVCRQVQEFLGLSPLSINAKPRPDREFPGPVVRRQLAEFYARPNQDLYEMLGDPQILQWTRR